jgi:hypothetical protein
MTPENRRAIEIFVLSQRFLHADENGLTDDCEFDDVRAIADTCPTIREITRGLNTPEEFLLNRLATLTEAVCMTWAAPNRQAVKEWRIARAELLELRIPRV